MATTYHHGISVDEQPGGLRPVSTVDTATIGIVGTAPDADTTLFQNNNPALIFGRTEAARLGTLGTLPAALDAIYDQAGTRGAPMVVAIVVAQGADAAATTTNIIGGTTADGDPTGLQALLSAKAVTGKKPKILIAPGFTQEQAVGTELIAQANRLQAFAFLDGPNTTDSDAIAYRQNFDAPRACLVDPWVTVRAADGSNATRPGSAVFAGALANSDLERGFWTTCSNLAVGGITGTSRSISFSLSDPGSRANLLNSNQVATFVQETGWRTWGARTLASDQKWAFIHVRRVADAINESLLHAHLWAVDKNLTKTYFEDVSAGVEAYMQSLQAISNGAIIAGRCWADKALNTSTEMSAGRVYFDFDFAVTGVAEHIVFRSRLNQGLLEEVLT